MSEIYIGIPIAGATVNDAEKDRAKTLAGRIKENRIGTVLEMGSGGGIQEIFVEVDALEAENAVTQIRKLVSECGFPENTKVEEQPGEEDDIH